MDNLLEIVEGNSAIIDITPLDETTGNACSIVNANQSGTLRHN